MKKRYRLTFYTYNNGWREYKFKTSYRKSQEQYYSEILTYFDDSAIGRLVANSNIDYVISTLRSSIVLVLDEEEYIICLMALNNDMVLSEVSK